MSSKLTKTAASATVAPAAAAKSNKEAAKPTVKPIAAAKPAATPAPPVKPSRAEIVALAKELNTVVSPTPPISVKANDATEVIMAQIENVSVALTSSDFAANGDGDPHLSAPAVATYIALGHKVPKAATKKAADIAKRKADREAAKANKPPKTPKEKAFTWTDATKQAIDKVCKKGGTMADIKAAALEIYKVHGEAGETMPKNVFRYMVTALVLFKVLVVADGKYSFPKPVSAA